MFEAAIDETGNGARSAVRANDPAKTLKVTMPASLQLQLVKMKLLTGKSLATIVVEALDEHFARMSQGAPLIPVIDDGGLDRPVL